MSKEDPKKIADSVLDLVGKTPLVRINKLSKDCHAEVIAKLESRNPCHSIKDRIGLAMIEEGERKGIIKEGSVLLESTSGNTGIGLAYVAAVKGYRLIIIMPNNMSSERRDIIKGFGAELILTPWEIGMKGAIAKMEELQREIPNSVLMRQFENEANPEIHRRTTAEEIWSDTLGEVDILVAGVGTGGTLTGVSEVLKERKPTFLSIAVEPSTSNVLVGGLPGPSVIQGIGPSFIPKVLNMKMIDEVFKVKDEEALGMTRRLMKEEGLFVGISSGAAVFAALEVGKRPENKGKMIVVILPDTAERYLSTCLYENI